MALQQIYEGTAEEIAAQLRISHPTGRLKAIVTQDELLVQSDIAPSLADSLADFLAEVDSQNFSPGPPPPNAHKREASRLIAEKFAKLGHTK